MFADNPDFYPTPRAIARRMFAKINKEASYFLEPSAGKGDIADVIREPMTFEEYEAENKREDNERYSDYHGSYRWGRDERKGPVNIDVIENYPDLIAVLRGKEYDVVGFDWLTYQGVSYYDGVLMNPPFSEGAAHLLKAWEFIHNGEIVCLLNEETIKNPHTEERRRLAKIIEAFGNVEYLGDCFSTAQRKTDVRVAMVYLKKVAPDDAADLWSQKPTQEKHFGVEFDGDPVMLAIRDNLGNMEHWFNMANEHWIKGIEHIRKASLFLTQNKVSERHGGNKGADFKTILGLAMANVHSCRAEFLRLHRRLAWTSVFEQMEFNRWLDSAQQERFLRDVERDSTIPFTADNIKSTLQNVFESRNRLFDESVAGVFDELCSYAVENGEGPAMPASVRSRYSEGWKTNDNYKVNKKLIFPWGCRYDKDFMGFQMNWGKSDRIYSDLDRILCVLDGEPFSECFTVGRALDNAFRGSTHTRQRYRSVSDQVTESQYFEIRFFKKGTVHLKWKREDLWEKFNLKAAAGKKWLGEDTQQYRPKKRKTGADIPWQCRDTHNFVDGKCSVCDEPEIDEVEAVECEWCRAIFEHTGRKTCPLHQEPVGPILGAYADTQQLLLEAVTQ